MPMKPRVPLLIRLPKHLADALTEIAREHGLTKNGAACLAIHEFSERAQPPPHKEPADTTSAA